MESDQSVVGGRAVTQQTLLVANRSSDVRLEVLTRLGHSLPGTRSPAEASTEVVDALAILDVAGIVSAVESDMAVVLAVNVPQTLTARLSIVEPATSVGRNGSVCG